MDMLEAFGDVNGTDRLVHHSGRLTTLTILDASRRADLLFLASASGLPNGHLSSHLSKLDEAGLITIAKSFLGGRLHTEVSLTALAAIACTGIGS
jgi:hypothetical protein